jgi:sugar phosphate permease
MHSYNRTHFLQLRWAIYIILILAYMSVFFHRMAPGVVSADLMLAFNTTGAALGSLAAMYYYIYTAMQIPERSDGGQPGGRLWLHGVWSGGNV